MRRGIIAGGNWIVDHHKVIDRWPEQDALVSIRRQSTGGGGAPYNVLKDLAHLGAPGPLAAVGLVGEDPDGLAIIADCRAHGIDVSRLRSTPAVATSYTDVMTVESTGRRTFFHQRGANALLGPEHFDFTGTPAKILHLGYLLLLDRLDELVDGRPLACEVLQRARQAGLLTSVDCVSEDSDRFGRIVTQALPEIDVLFANDFEAERLTGVRLRQDGRISGPAVAQAAGELLRQGVRSWVILHFPEAACAFSRNGVEVWQPSLRIPAEAIAGAAGAGDALAAGVLFGLHEDWPMARCLELGVCAAGASLFHPSCTEGVRPAADCLYLARRFGYQELPAGESRSVKMGTRHD
jgi:sugar/nucleoside kinase (ribokinase family)